MRTFIIAVMLLCFSFGGVTAAFREFNGVNWSRLDTLRIDQKILYSVKLSYIMGLLRSRDERMLYSVQRNETPSLAVGDTSQIKPDEIVQLLDFFYKDNRNLHIPLVHAFVVACARLSGVAESTIDSSVQGLQGRYSN